MKISQDGIDLIKHFETFVPTPYKCPAGKPTIGYGHVILKNEHFDHLTETDAEDLLRGDVGIAEEGVQRSITVPLEIHQFDALVSFAFNVGTWALTTSTLRRKVNAGLHLEVPEQFMRWVYAHGEKLKGLVRRRAAEAAMYSGSDWRKFIVEDAMVQTT
jgi:lysozyme